MIRYVRLVPTSDTVETVANLLATELGTHLPTGAAATLILVMALILFLAFNHGFEG